MTIASVTTDINMGPYVIPSNAQNMIMNFYASRHDLKIELVVPEPIFSFKYATTIWLHEQYKFTQILLCSMHQLPSNLVDLENLHSSLPDVMFHFALEGVYGVLKDRLKFWVAEIAVFNGRPMINGDQHGWLGLHELMLNS